MVYTFYKEGTETTGQEEIFAEENIIRVPSPLNNGKLYEIQPSEKKFFDFEGKMNLDIIASEIDKYYIDRLITKRPGNIGFIAKVPNSVPIDESDIYAFKGSDFIYCDNQVSINGYVVRNASSNTIYVVPKKGYRE